MKKDSEHPLDRLIRIHQETERHLRWEFHGDDGYRWITGKYATKRWWFYKNHVTILQDCECQICKKRGNGKTVKKVYEYADPIGWVKHTENKYFTRLCNKCWMTLRNARVKYSKYEQLALEIRRFQRKQNESTKNNARTA